jgi:fibronectin-binding autotransporter adhesin
MDLVRKKARGVPWQGRLGGWALAILAAGLVLGTAADSAPGDYVIVGPGTTAVPQSGATVTVSGTGNTSTVRALAGSTGVSIIINSSGAPAVPTASTAVTGAAMLVRDGSLITVNSGGGVQTTYNSGTAPALRAAGSGNGLIVNAGGFITTTGVYGYGLLMGGSPGITNSNTANVAGSISVSGSGAYGILCGGTGMTSVSGNQLLLDGTGSILVTGNPNAGTISTGIGLFGGTLNDTVTGNSVTVHGTISVSGNQAVGLYLNSGLAGTGNTITVDGAIHMTGASGDALDSFGHGTLTTLSGAADIASIAPAVHLWGDTQTLHFSGGTISTTGPNGYGVWIMGDATLPCFGNTFTMDSGAHISTTGALGFGVISNGTANTFDMAGHIVTQGDNAFGVSVTGDGNIVTLRSAGLIETYGAGAHGLSIGGTAGQNNTLTVAGTIHASGSAAAGIASGVAGATVTVNPGADVQGGAYGLLASGPLTLTNSGSIAGGAGATRAGVYLNHDALVNNMAGGQIHGYSGLYGASGYVTLDNYGSIQGTGGAGVDSLGGGSLINRAGAVIHSDSGPGLHFSGNVAGGVNYGLISTTSGAAAVHLEGVGPVPSLTFINQTGGAITGPAVGIRFDSARGILSNYGTILGGAGDDTHAAIVMSAQDNDFVTLGTAGTVTGDIRDQGGANDQLILEGSGAQTLGNAIVGFETFSKREAGTWTLTSTASFATAGVEGGTLLVNGRLTTTGVAPTRTGGLVVLDGGTLGGAGTLAGSGVEVLSGGRVSPGNSIGTLTVDGDYTHRAGAVLHAEINPAGDSDRLQVTGHATLEGGTVEVDAAAGAYNPATQYTLLTAAGGIQGEFDNLITNLAFMNPILQYDLNTVLLAFEANAATFKSVARTPNQRAVAAALDHLSGTATGDLSTVIDGLQGLSAPQARRAFDQMGGEVYSAATTAPLMASDLFRQSISLHLTEQRDALGLMPTAAAPAVPFLTRPKTDPEMASGEGSPVAGAPAAWKPRVENWGGFLGDTARLKGDGNSATFHDRTAGGILGMDYRLRPDLTFGGAFAFTHSHVDLSRDNDSAEVDGYQAALYFAHTPRPFWVNGMVGYGFFDESLRRRLDFGPIDRTAQGDRDGHQVMAALEAGYRFSGRGFNLDPYVGLDYAHLYETACRESGAGDAGLRVRAQDLDSLRSTVGLRVNRPMSFFSGSMVVTPELRAAWRHEYLDTDRVTTGSFLGGPGATFSVRGAQPGRDAALLGAGVTAQLSDRVSVRFDYNTILQSRLTSHTFNVNVCFTW